MVKKRVNYLNLYSSCKVTEILVLMVDHLSDLTLSLRRVCYARRVKIAT